MIRLKANTVLGLSMPLIIKFMKNKFEKGKTNSGFQNVVNNINNAYNITATQN